MKQKLTAAVALAGALSLAACGGGSSTAEAGSGSEAESGFPKTVASCGEDVTVEEEPTVMTVGANAMNFVAAAGAGDMITARGGEFGLPAPEPYADALEGSEVVADSDPTAEQIVGTGANLVVTSGLFATTPEDLADSGVQTLVVNGSCAHAGMGDETVDFDSINAQIESYGEFFGTADAAQKTVEENEAALASAQDAGAEMPERTAAAVYYFGEGSPLSAYGGNGLVNSQFELFNLRNSFADVDQDYFETNAEAVVDAAPDVLVVAYGFSGEDFETAKQQVLSEPGFSDLEAVKNDRIVGVPSSLIDPSPLAFGGLAELEKQLADLS